MDAIATIEVDDDGRAEVIARRSGGETLNLAWLQAQQASARGFEEHAIGEVPAASREIGAQGHAPSQIVEGGRPSLRSQAVSECSTFPSPTTRRRGR
ncbi:hypothetical protein BQ8794_50034 [Mesorhizobium prunaredense]|uniref:Uncharacterized protein n=1 Tax=Mesorhizobium prunaredense TaxID=1631249 RepID=A0A1R3VDB0_9HYPH|nr:hypothetical protein [Mesorhizobium prunaredense]SIT57932.1 hypothetical protein BQ8794_50034 [Mesorhizobium prunaredense]